MKVTIEIGELVIRGLPEDQGGHFARHLQEEVARRLAGARDVPSRSLEDVRIERTRPPSTVAEAAAEVARAITARPGS